MGGEELEMANIMGHSFEKFFCKGEPWNERTTVGGNEIKSRLTKKLGEIFVADANGLEEKETIL